MGWSGFAGRLTRIWLAAAGLCAAVACAPASPPGLEPEPEPVGEPDREERVDAPSGEARADADEPERRIEPASRVEDLPPIPRVAGPLALRVQYPERHQRIAVRDSNFIFGAVGTGDATLEIDGRPVPVEPNGAFLAFLPVPEPRGDTAFYRLVARESGRADTLLHPVLLPALPHVGAAGEVWLDTAALQPEAERWALAEESYELDVRGAPGLDVWAEVGARRFPLEEGPDPARARLEAGAVAGGGVPPSRRYRARVRIGRLAEAAGLAPSDPERLPAEAAAREDAVPREATGADAPWVGALALAAPDTLTLTLVGAAAGDTARLVRRIPFLELDPDRLPVVVLREAADSVHGAAGVIPGRPSPDGSYRWLFPPGARAVVDGRQADRLRLRLAPHEAAWVLAEDAEPLPPDTEPPASSVGDMRVEHGPDRLVLRLPLEVPLPIQVDEPDSRSLRLTVYGATGRTDRVSYGERDALLESVAWEQASDALYQVAVRLRKPVWGYRAAYDEEGSELRLEIRRPPAIDRRRPLRGRRVAVDPGHPGAGAHGPTGLYEGDANLAVARHLAELLREAGARPVLIRADTFPMGLYERTGRAVEAGAELFVSIHNNALPDGVRPFGREGSSTYYYHPHSRDLAAAVQDGLLAEMDLRDLGIFWGDLAVARMSWMPSVLAEGAFMMIPRHEAALRRPEFQRRYARGVVRGLREFLARRAEAARHHP